MPARLDHLVVVAQSLEAGARLVEESLGLRPGPGRKQQHKGTHNLLLSLGSSAYMEVLAIDPEALPVSRPRSFGLGVIAVESEARFAAGVASTDDIHRPTSPELGEVEKMERDGLT